MPFETYLALGYAIVVFGVFGATLHWAYLQTRGLYVPFGAR